MKCYFSIIQLLVVSRQFLEHYELLYVDNVGYETCLQQSCIQFMYLAGVKF